MKHFNMWSFLYSDNSKVKQIAIDMFLNLIGTGFPLAVLQLVIYPIVAQLISSTSYGEMQSTMSLVYLVGGTLGGTLSTTRLVRQYDYKTYNKDGDFNQLFWGCIITVIIVTFVAAFLYFNNSFYYIALTVLVALGCCITNYLEVGFRLELNFKKILIAKIISCIGYILGFGVFYLTKNWQYIFIFSFLLVAIFCVKKTNIIYEPFTRTELFPQTIKAFFDLGIANLLGKALTYFDKLILYPLLGGEAVAIYFAANIFGKLILQVLEPITNVILSYLSKTGNVGHKTWKLTVVIGGVACIVMYFICVLVSGPILGIFYPQWRTSAVVLIPITTASLCISSFVSIIYPLTLKTINTNRQIIINATSLITYIIAVILLFSKYELFGCCIALLISYIVQLIVMILFVVLKRDNNTQRD